MAEIRQSGEQKLIASVFAPLTQGFAGAAGLVDDAAAVRPRDGFDLVVTKDLLVAGVHFLDDDDPGAIARKALRVNLSDLAAKGAVPTLYFLGLALTDHQGGAWLEAFASGLADDQAVYGCILGGGDLTRTPGNLTISVTAIGEVPEGGIVRRGGATAGDALYVSGTIGDAVLGLALRNDARAPWGDALGADGRSSLLDRYLLPRPRVALAPAVAQFASAAMDVSDGLAGDLAQLARASGIGAEVALGDVPLSAAAAQAVAVDQSLLERLVTGGDDYEILCSVAPSREAAFVAAARAADVAVTRIGAATGSGELAFRDRDGRLCAIDGGYSHFS